jgi:hypothetical protein
VTWYEVQSLRDVPAQYREFVVDLDQAMARLGLQYNRTMRIRFNQVDDYQIPFDGLALDDISLEGVPARRVTVQLPAEGVEGAGLLSEPGWVTLHSPVTSATAVRLSSTAPANVSVPAIVTIPAGADRSSFPVTLLENVTVDGTLRVSVQAESSGYIGGRGELLVLDNESVSLRVSLPPRAREGAGRLSRQGSVRASHRTSRPVQVQLTSSAAGAAGGACHRHSPCG